MAIISSKSYSILSKMGISTYQRRKNLGQNMLNEVILHKRDSVLVILSTPLKDYSKEEQSLFMSIMKTITSENPLIEESLNSYNPLEKNGLSSLILAKSTSVKGIISFGVAVDLADSFIQAPCLKTIIDNPAAKKPLWEDIKKIFIN
jgi:hypothetical protein|tara:strand:+ start:1500 stop:1940 length:441 start_codon:yes stop_codon:yes gene_type:complete